MSALVSVIVPTRNRAHMIADAIASIREQRGVRTEIIVVDDGSTDDTLDLLSRETGIRVLTQPTGGQAAARNRGFAAARGEFCATLDSDDVWYPDFLAETLEAIESGPYDLVFANWHQQVGAADKVDGLGRYREFRSHVDRAESPCWWRLDADAACDLFFRTCPAPSSSMLLRCASLPTQPWSSEFRIADDWIMALDTLTRHRRGTAFTTRPLWYKRQDHRNIYDGQPHHYALEHLHVHDYERLIARFRPCMSETQLERARRRLATDRIALLFAIPGLPVLSRRFASGITHAFRDHPRIAAGEFGRRTRVHLIATARHWLQRARRGLRRLLPR